MILPTYAQIEIVDDINPGTGNSSPANLFVFNGYVYFAADDADATTDHGRELWRTNGTTTELVKDINEGDGNSVPQNFFSIENTLYFTANNGSSSVIFSYDGTGDNTVDMGLSTGVYFPVSLGGKVYFNNTINDKTLYIFDGSSISAASNNGTLGAESLQGANFVAFDSKLLLYMSLANEEETVGKELYQYDPTTGVYTLIKDITGDDSSSSISNLTVLNDEVYFEALGYLYVTDGTEDGTKQIDVASSLSGVANLYAWNDKIFFEGDNGTEGDQLYIYDPNAGTVTNLSQISGTNSDHDPSDYCAYNGYLYYAGKDSETTKKHLYRTDGSSVEELNSDIIDLDEIIELDGILYFEAEDATGTETTGNELFSFDPSSYTTGINDEADIQQVVTVYPNPCEGVLNIKGLQYNEASYKLFNVSGKLVQSGEILSDQIEIEKPSGIYILNIVSGNKVQNYKIQVK